MHVDLVIKLKLPAEAFDLCGDAPPKKKKKTQNETMRVTSHGTAQSMSHYSFITDH